MHISLIANIHVYWSRLYYHETADSCFTTEVLAAKDVHKSRLIHLHGKLAGVTNDMYRLVPPQQQIEFKFTKADPKFYLYRERDDDGKEYVVEIHNAYLHLTRVRLTQNAMNAFMRRWKKEKIYYMPYTRTEVC